MAILKPSAEYNRRAAIIESLRARRSEMEIIRFFGYPRLTAYNGKIYSFRTIQRRFYQQRSHHEQSLKRFKLWFRMTRIILINVMKPWKLTSGRPYVFQQDSTGLYKSFDSKLALRQRRYVLIEGILASQQPRFKSRGLLWNIIERITNKSLHPNMTSLRTLLRQHSSAWIAHYSERFRPRIEAVIQTNGGYIE